MDLEEEEPDLARVLRRVALDRSSGAHRLAEESLAAIRRAVGRWNGVRTSTLRERVRAMARALDRTQPAMGVFRQWSAEWHRLARNGSPGKLLGALGRWSQRWSAQLRRERPGLVRTVQRRIPPRVRVLTISRSDSVRTGLLRLPASRRPRAVLALESRPGGEGRRMARELRRGGLPARVVPDRRAEAALGHVDLVLVGADAVYADGSLIHKVGTRPLAAAAARLHVPLVVLAGRSKWVEGRRPPRALPAQFDRTPARFIREFWTDAGVRRPPRTRAARHR